jgi:hypothetical protein
MQRENNIIVGAPTSKPLISSLMLGGYRRSPPCVGLERLVSLPLHHGPTLITLAYSSPLQESTVTRGAPIILLL